MELVKNTVSGRLFIVLEDVGNSNLLLITPEGLVKRLGRHLFAPQDSDNSSNTFSVHQLTEKQIEVYTQYDGRD